MCSTSNERAVSNIVKVGRLWVAVWHTGCCRWPHLQHTLCLPGRRCCKSGSVEQWQRAPHAMASSADDCSCCTVPPHDSQVMLGDRIAQHMRVFAGDCVPKKKPAPDIYNLAAQVGLQCGTLR